MTLRSFQAVWFGHRFAREVVLIYPVYAVMMTENVSEFAFATLIAFWSASVLFAELPTGTLGDRLSRVRLIGMSDVIKGIGFLSWFLLPNYGGYLLGFVLWGVGSTLRSGTEEALLHDTLHKLGVPERFEQIHGRGAAAGSLGTMVAFLGGGLLAEHSGFALPLALSVLGPWVAAAIAWLGLTDVPRTGAAPEEHEAYLDTLRAGVREAVGRPLVFRVVLMTASIACIWGLMDEFMPVFMSEKGSITLFDIGIVYAAMSGANVVAVALAHRIPARTPRRVAAVFSVAAVFLALSVPTSGYVAAAILVISFGINGAASVLLTGQLQRAIRGHARATVTSVAGTGAELTGIMLALAGGGAAEVADWHGATTFFAVLALLLAAIFMMKGIAGGTGPGRIGHSSRQGTEVR